MNANAWTLARELIYEQVRQEHFSSKPSRFDALFLCFSEVEAEKFRSSTSRPFDLIYEVELMEPTAPTHIGNWALINWNQNDNIETLKVQAHAYWLGSDLTNRELVTSSPAKVVRRC